MKARIVEVIAIVATSLVLLGSYHIYERIKAHNEMDRALLSLIQRNGKVEEGK